MSDQTSSESVSYVVAVEDNPGDVRLVEEGVESTGLGLDMQVLNNGTRAIDWLFGSDADTREATPQLVFLDLNLPGNSGFEVLETVRDDESLSDLPVVVVSSSENPDDIRRAYELGANAYITKPADPDEYIRVIAAAIDFWITQATRPRQ